MSGAIGLGLGKLSGDHMRSSMATLQVQVVVCVSWVNIALFALLALLALFAAALLRVSDCSTCGKLVLSCCKGERM